MESEGGREGKTEGAGGGQGRETYGRTEGWRKGRRFSEQRRMDMTVFEMRLGP